MNDVSEDDYSEEDDSIISQFNAAQRELKKTYFR
jgi:hypothetical protein